MLTNQTHEFSQTGHETVGQENAAPSEGHLCLPMYSHRLTQPMLPSQRYDKNTTQCIIEQMKTLPQWCDKMNKCVRTQSQ